MVTNLKQTAKDLAGRALLTTGFWERRLQTWARRGQTVVLTYHRVLDKWDQTLDYSQPGMVVTAEMFDRQLAFLKNYFHIVPLSSLLSDRETGRLHDKPRCAITFDDGWRDNYDNAFPIIKKHEIPATTFLTSDYIGTDRIFWHTELMYLLLNGQLSQLKKASDQFTHYPKRVRTRLMRLARLTERPSAPKVDELIETVRENCNEATIENLLVQVANTLGIQRPFLRDRRFFMDWNQVREMTGAGIEIGSHGCTHRSFKRMRDEEVAEELVRSKREIEAHINRTVCHFAFPYGVCNTKLVELVGQAGYSTACHGVGHRVTSSGCWCVSRVCIHQGVSSTKDKPFSRGTFALSLARIRAASLRESSRRIYIGTTASSMVMERIGGLLLRQRHKCWTLISEHCREQKGRKELFFETVNPVINKNSLLLDAGCGKGRGLAQDYKDLVKLAIGIDVSFNDLQHNHSMHSHVQGDVHILPFREEIFDVVVSQWCIEHLRIPTRFFSDVCRILKPGGYFIFCTPNLYCYITLVSRITPLWVHRYFNRALLGIDERDVFETYYRANTIRKLDRQLSECGLFRRRVLLYEEPPWLWTFSVMLCKAALKYRDLVMRSRRLNRFCGVIFAVYQKP